ncbi:glycosyltransferase family 4 protein [Agrobacterium tumefaciens]|nr:glycosyltransferase family 4 protein [Agrobacterium tumefaciens]NTE21964.1 glycosyltransferase family 4 protein [Agrobacterium tumefaciens]
MIKDNLNIIVVNDFANINGGAAKVATDTAIGLSENHCNVYYFCGTGSIDPTLLNNQIRGNIHLGQQEVFNSKNKLSALIRGLWNHKAYREMKSLLKGFDNTKTIIHVHGWTKVLSISPIVASLRAGFKVVITLHDFFIYCPNGGFYNYKKHSLCSLKPLSGRCLASNCDSRNYSIKIYRVIRSAIQRFSLKFYKKRLNFISISELSDSLLRPYTKKFASVDYVENPIDIFRVPKVDVSKNNLAVYIGRISNEKGAVYLCEAIQKLGNPPVTFVGLGNMMPELKLQFPELNFVGWQNKEQIKELLMKARFLVFPSVCYETYGLVVQEAAAFGVPAIVSNSTAACEFVEHGVDGLIFKSKDINDLSEKLNKMYSDDDYVSNLGSNMYNKFWGNNHSMSKYVNDLKNVYEQILDTENKCDNYSFKI